MEAQTRHRLPKGRQEQASPPSPFAMGEVDGGAAKEHEAVCGGPECLAGRSSAGRGWPCRRDAGASCSCWEGSREERVLLHDLATAGSSKGMVR
jgi:hypothetical protein